MSAASYAPTSDALGDVRIFLTPEGAAYLKAQRRPSVPLLTCAEPGCTEAQGFDNEFCERHQLVDAF